MEMDHIYRENGLPGTLSTNNNPWLVAHNLDDNGIVNFYTTIDEQPSNYRCRIPELQKLKGVHIQGFCHGWAILSNHPHDVMWYLWDPVTSKLIRLPPLARQDDSDIVRYCCLSSPPGDPAGSVLLLMRYENPTFVFCRLDRKRKRSKWTEMSYAKQLKRLMGGEEGGILDWVTCCNGKVYALSYDTFSVLQIDITVVKNKQVVINILPFQKYPMPYIHSLPDFCMLKGSSTELFAITGRCDASAGVYLFKLDLTTTTHDDDSASSTWEEIHDLKDDVFFVDLTNLQVSYIPAVASSGLGGYVHIRNECRIIINSFHVKDRTLSVFPMPCLAKAFEVSIWEYYRGLESGNNREVKCTDDYKEKEDDDKENDDEIVVLMRSSSHIEKDNESRLLDVPFHVLEMIMELCVGIEYMNFRATCKRCHLAAPQIHWRNKTALRKLQKYSLVSPWLMVVVDNGGIMNFTDPVSGDKYLMKLRLPAAISLNHDELSSISCSKYGWWLFYSRSIDLEYHPQLVFFKPFTNDARKLPPTPPHYLESLCFSAPPTSANCLVVGFSTKGHAAYILRYVDQEEQLLWRRFDVDYGGAPYAFRFPTFHGRDLYAVCNEGRLVVFKDMNEGRFSQPEVVAAEPPQCWPLHPQYFLMKRGQYLLLVIDGMFGGDPKLFQFNDSTKEWSQIESLDRHVIFIDGATCVCIEAKRTPKIQNKIYFPRLKDEKLIFYSLETSKYHTFDGKLAAREEAWNYACLSFRSTMHLSLNAWIEPSWY